MDYGLSKIQTSRFHKRTSQKCMHTHWHIHSQFVSQSTHSYSRCLTIHVCRVHSTNCECLCAFVQSILTTGCHTNDSRVHLHIPYLFFFSWFNFSFLPFFSFTLVLSFHCVSIYLTSLQCTHKLCSGNERRLLADRRRDVGEFKAKKLAKRAIIALVTNETNSSVISHRFNIIKPKHVCNRQPSNIMIFFFCYPLL